MNNNRFPPPRGLYDPAREKDSCGVGFLCDIKGRPSHHLLGDALAVLERLAHRGAAGADPETGDGAGIMIQMPHAFFQKVAPRQRFRLPAPGRYGAGLVFLPADRREREMCRRAMENTLAGEGHLLMGWRKVPVDEAAIGAAARESRPAIEQVFVSGPAAESEPADFERKLYVARRSVENAVSRLRLKPESAFYISNLSSRTLTYKGLLAPGQLKEFYPDLRDDAMRTAIAVVHSRYSTNTFPSWTLAQPFRFLAHNGEINTLQGNLNRMRAREKGLRSSLFGKDIEKIKPVSMPGASDSAALDNLLELLVHSGRSMAHALMMLMPAAWENDRLLDRRQRDFYRYHACFCEPWDGPAAVAFTDGTSVGAALDRNGLRPARYLVTRDGRVIMASEAGVLDVDPAGITSSGRLRPGQLFVVDTVRQRILADDEIKEETTARTPYGRWLRENLLDFPGAATADSGRANPGRAAPENLPALSASFGYTREDLDSILKPMAEEGAEPTASMGNDTPPAVFSRNPQPVFNYFKQLFAQVTNPSIDPIREELVMSMDTCLGTGEGLLGEGPGNCRGIYLRSPFLLDSELAGLRALGKRGFPSRTISLLLAPGEESDFPSALDRLENEAEEAVSGDGCRLLVLSDRGTSRHRAAMPSLLALGAVQRRLVEKGLRGRAGLLVESAEPREAHHFALLFGYGADAVTPYLALMVIGAMAAGGEIRPGTGAAVENYRLALEKGVKKIMSKMGISTLSGYRDAQVFECLGLSGEVTGRCFRGTPSRIGGAGFRELAAQTAGRHRLGYPGGSAAVSLPSDGRLAFRRDGEFHAWRPETISALQKAARNNDRGRYLEFAALLNDRAPRALTLRGAMKFRPGRAIDLSEVEPAESIMRRFAAGAMSFGSISRDAHHTLAIAMNRIGGRSNTGEGGEDPRRSVPLPSGDSLRSAIKQVASGRFGVTAGYLADADEIQIKIAQGAKPGEGGQLPGHKVSAEIARHRCTAPGVTLISPPPHHDIYSIEDLAQLIFDLKQANPGARVSVKLVSAAGVGTVAAGVAKGHADMILISGGGGGTGAAPLGSIFHAGLPWELGLSEAHQTLMLNNLRGRVRLQADGQLRTGRDVAVAAALGADEFGFASAPLVVMGCMMLRHCHLNNCPMGVATQDEKLTGKFRGRPEHLVNYFRFVAEELRTIMSLAGTRSVTELVGRADLLEMDPAAIPARAGRLDYRKILYRPPALPPADRCHAPGPGAAAAPAGLDEALLDRCAAALERKAPASAAMAIRNTDRAAGALLSGAVARKFGAAGLPDDTIRISFRGTAGQSFGAWLAPGITLCLEGMANDYVGKGLSGGKLVIRPDRAAGYPAEDNVIIGNTAFYGATSGQAFIRGLAGERFAVRNSGLRAVVEGVGDHGCEYMTGGLIVVIGPTGRNFAAGMSGGLAFVYDPGNFFPAGCSREMVTLRGMNREDEGVVAELLREHLRLTASVPAARILDSWTEERGAFIKVLPRDARHRSRRRTGEKSSFTA